MTSSLDPVMQPNAEGVLRKPEVTVLLLAFIAGAMDAVDFRVYGVFTANQAGNLVLVWERLADTPGEATLSLFSLVGCAVGISLVILLRLWRPFFVTPQGSRMLLYIAAILLGITAFAGVRLETPLREVSTGELKIGSAQWWAGAVSTSSSAIALAALGTIFIMVGGSKANVISSTGPFIDSIRFGAARILTKDRVWNRSLKAVIFFPIAWSLGAAFSSLVPLNRGIIATFCAVAVVVLTLTSRGYPGKSIRITNM